MQTNTPNPNPESQSESSDAACAKGVMQRFFKRAWWLAAVLILIPAQLSHAQYRASLQGTVTDTEGALVPGATLTLTDKETNHATKAVSDGSGNFTFSELPPSKFTLVVERDGFKKKVLDNISVLSEQANALTVKMEIGGNSETVTVNAAETPLIDTETGSISGTVDQNEIAKLPSFGRDVFQLAQLAPGVFGDGAQSAGGGTNGLAGNQGPGGSGGSAGVFQTENRPQVSGNGGRPDSNGVTLDGVGISSVTWGSAAIITPSEDSIKEMKVVANDYDAEYGRFGASQIQVTSQNGTNQYHGTAFIKLDRPGLNAYQRYDPNNNPQRDTNRFNQIGGTLGGPILHNRLFAFFSYETIRNNSTSTGGGWYDTAAFDGLGPAGSISSQYLTLKGAGVVYSKILEGTSDMHTCADVNLVEGVTCKFIPGAGLDLGRPLTGVPLGTQDPSYRGQVTAGNSIAYVPGLGGDGTGGPQNFDGVADIFYVATANPFNQVNEQYNGRVDYQATSKDLIAGSLYYVPVTQTSINGPNRGYNTFHHDPENYAATALWNHTFSGSLLNEARADMAGWKWNEIESNPQIPYGLPIDNINTTSFGNPYGGGNGASVENFGPSIGSIFDQWTFNAKDVMTTVYKSHNLKFGAQYTRLAYLDEAPYNTDPSFDFNNLWDFVNDAPTTENATADPRTGVPSSFRKDTRNNIWGIFFQDDWKVKPNFTVNLGLRWEYFGGMTEKNGNLGNLRLGSGSAELSGIRFQLGGPEFNAQKDNLGPQVGFAWSPSLAHDRLVVRGGFGMGYTGLEAAITTNTRFNPPFLSNSANLTGSQILYATSGTPYTFDGQPANPNLVTAFDANNLPTANVQLSVTGLPTDWHTAMNYRFSLQGQYDLGHQWVGTVGYQGSLGRHLPLQNNLNNELAPAIIAGQIAYNPKLQFIDWYEDTGNSSFNALLLELHHQFSHSYEVDAQYRWAKSLDNGSGPYVEPDYAFLPGLNYGPSDFDVRNMFKVWGLWSPVLFHGNHGYLEKIAGGWTVSGILNLHSGFPFSPNYGGIGCNAVYQNSGDCNLRAASYNGQASTSQSTDAFKQSSGNFTNGGSTYFTAPTVVQGPAWPTDGTAPTPGPLPGLPGIGRNAFFGPRYFDTDMTLTKAFGLPSMRVLGEGAKLELRGNAYNLFNKLNLASPDTNITDTHFGRAQNVLGSRTIEVEAHFKF